MAATSRTARKRGIRVLLVLDAFGSQNLKRTWTECAGELIAGDTFFPKRTFDTVDGGVTAGIFFVSPRTGNRPAERFVTLSRRNRVFESGVSLLSRVL
jgi:hypothetical protein